MGPRASVHNLLPDRPACSPVRGCGVFKHVTETETKNTSCQQKYIFYLPQWAYRYLKSGHISPKQLYHFATFYEPHKFTTTSIHTPRLAFGTDRQGVGSLENSFCFK